MKSRMLKRAAVALTIVGMSVPQSQIVAAEQVKKERAAAVPVADVALTAAGALNGKVIDAQGLALDGAAVVVYSGKNEVARTVADRSGAFSVNELRGGVYRIAAGQGQTMVRAWSANTAPPAARRQAVVVSSAPVVRGQLGTGGGVLLAAGVVTTIILSGIAVSRINDVNDELEAQKELIEKGFDQLPKSP